jgi:hypothetical protein
MLTVGLALLVLGTLGVLLKLVRRLRPSAMPPRRILIVEAAVLAFWVVGGSALASLREHRAEAAWGALAPPGPAAPSAAGPQLAALVKRAAALGVSLVAPDSTTAGAGPSGEGLLAELGPYLDRVLRQADDAVAPAPAELRAWLVVQDAAVRALEPQLAEGGPLEWGPLGADDALPYATSGVLKLDGVLVAAALERVRAGDAAGASGALEAAAGLAGSLRDRPETASRLVALALDRRLLGALRLVDPVPPGWERRLDAIEEHTRPGGALPAEMRELMARASGSRTTLRGLLLEMDVAPQLKQWERRPAGRLLLALSGGPVPLEGIAQAVSEERKRIETPFYSYLQGPLEQPYVRLVVADYAMVQAQTAAAVAAGDSCGAQPIAPPARLASWNPLGDAGASLQARLARSRAVLRAELELTRLVLRARSLRAQSPSREWPSELPGADVSRACPGRRFVARTEDGVAEIRLEPQAFGEKEATVAFRMGAATGGQAR